MARIDSFSERFISSRIEWKQSGQTWQRKEDSNWFKEICEEFGKRECNFERAKTDGEEETRGFEFLSRLSKTSEAGTKNNTTAGIR